MLTATLFCLDLTYNKKSAYGRLQSADKHVRPQVRIKARLINRNNFSLCVKTKCGKGFFKPLPLLAFLDFCLCRTHVRRRNKNPKISLRLSTSGQPDDKVIRLKSAYGRLFYINFAILATIKQISIPRIVGMITERAVHFRLPVSFFIVSIVVEHGQ